MVEVVAIVRVLVLAVAAASVTPGAEHVGGLVPPLGVTEQLMVTAPVNPPVGSIVSTSGTLLPGTTDMVLEAGMMVNPGAAVLTGATTCRPRV